MSVVPGSRFGPYEVLSTLGAGAMGDVYRARDARLNRDVALKVLPPLWAGDAGRLRRFEQEARATAILNHPNILAVYDVGTHDDQPYIVTELLEGATLREALADGALPPSKAVDIARQLASGLAAAHAKGIAHRDIKPENLFLTPDGRVKILDFGLAKLNEDAGGGGSMTRSPAATEPGVVLGTVNYMSPEQVRGQTADARSDIFSVGVVLFEMLTGARPFQGDSSVETMSAILKQDAPDLSARRTTRACRPSPASSGIASRKIPTSGFSRRRIWRSRCNRRRRATRRHLPRMAPSKARPPPLRRAGAVSRSPGRWRQSSACPQLVWHSSPLCGARRTLPSGA